MCLGCAARAEAPNVGMGEKQMDCLCTEGMGRPHCWTEHTRKHDPDRKGTDSRKKYDKQETAQARKGRGHRQYTGYVSVKM